MAFTRKFLKALGIEDEKVEQIIDAHTEVTDGLKKKISEAEEKAEQYDELQKEMEKYRKQEGYKDKYEKEHADFEAYKKDVTAKETRSQKSGLVQKYLESKGITGGNLDIAMMAIDGQIDKLELDGEKIKDTKALDDLVSGKLSSLVVSKSTKGVNTSTPPTNNAGSAPRTKEDIKKIKDTTERQKAWAQYLADQQKG